MLNLKPLVILCCLVFLNQVVYSQLGFSHEIGVIAGPVEFRSDFGSRFDEETNLGNSGIGIGIVHYINFAYRADCNCYSTDTYFNDHFKLRNEISWNYTRLDHHGEWVKPKYTSANADKLRTHHGVAENFDIGTQLEYFPRSIRSFQAFSYLLAPYISLGIHYTSSSPQGWTDYGDQDIFNAANIYSYWYQDPQFLPPVPAGEQREYPVDVNPFSDWSMVASVGARYKIGVLSDLLIDLRWQLYFNDWVDGFNHKLSYNKFNDWLLWLNVGYIYYLD
ncbi:THC0290_0291 family protein [Seonamhaeicola maritimus]|uniref:Glutamate dehydrogenase n=1 Tax=Seonamhaeicola maritimus TaxID=2591822 RepID=A0A5C7GHQ5_9FLAO|nr:glutamate dehydrogenase [Seonamhaeicola maritimus]TXG37023.1 glutamate dehydrogenase [Seonamhaeicola maritimus]